MKKLILSAAVAFAGIVGLNAQSMESLQIGAKAGYNYSNLRGDTPDKMDLKGLSGYHVGLFVEVPVTERFSVQPEVNYSTQGAKWEKAKSIGDFDLKTQNITVPVLAKFYIADGFNIQAGPQISFLTDSKFEFDGKELEIFKKVKDAMSKVNYGAVVGAGYKLPMGVSFDARYNFGLSNIFDKDNEDIKSAQIGDDFKNGVFSVGVGYQF